MRTSRALPWFVVVVTGAAVAACSADPDDARSGAFDRPAIDTQGQPFSTTPFEPNHEAIVAAGLPFLKPEIVLALQAADVSVDVEFHFVSANHFDDCNFSGGSRVVAERQAAAVDALDPSLPVDVTDPVALFAFGQSLHTVQDFYAHSNWVELGASGLVDDGLTAFPTLSGYATIDSSGIRVVEGVPPKATKVWRAGSTYPENAIVFVKTKSEKSFGLISGTVDYEPGDSCPANVALTHEELNKDTSTTPGREAQHATAMAIAIRQTAHEWCRLVALAEARWGQAGVTRLSSWLADPTAPSPCSGLTPAATLQMDPLR